MLLGVAALQRELATKSPINYKAVCRWFPSQPNVHAWDEVGHCHIQDALPPNLASPHQPCKNGAVGYPQVGQRRRSKAGRSDGKPPSLRRLDAHQASNTLVQSEHDSRCSRGSNFVLTVMLSSLASRDIRLFVPSGASFFPASGQSRARHACRL